MERNREKIKETTEDSRNENGCSVAINFPIEEEYFPIITEYIKEKDENYIRNNREESFITLAHELIHALHFQEGKVAETNKTNFNHTGLNNKIYSSSSETIKEELYTIGLLDNGEITENKIREEHKLNLKNCYGVDNEGYFEERLIATNGVSDSEDSFIRDLTEEELVLVNSAMDNVKRNLNDLCSQLDDYSSGIEKELNPLIYDSAKKWLDYDLSDRVFAAIVSSQIRKLIKGTSKN